MALLWYYFLHYSSHHLHSTELPAAAQGNIYMQQTTGLLTTLSAYSRNNV